MEAIVKKDWNDKSYLVALVWEDDELDKMYFIPGTPNYSRSGWNAEEPARKSLEKLNQERIRQLLWGK